MLLDKRIVGSDEQSKYKYSSAGNKFYKFINFTTQQDNTENFSIILYVWQGGN